MTHWQLPGTPLSIHGVDDSAPLPFSLSPAAHIFASLTGAWRIARTIQPQGEFLGTAVFTPTKRADQLSYREEGETIINGKAIAGHRDFLYQLTGDNLEIRFAEAYRRGDLYVSLGFMEDKNGSWVARSVHPCAADQYDHEMRWLSSDDFETRIAASGPTKDYVLVTQYHRISG